MKLKINEIGFPDLHRQRLRVRRTVVRGVFFPENYRVFPVVFNNMVCYNWI